jgi:D-alanyl-D-alanine carboxypeptidase
MNRAKRCIRRLGIACVIGMLLAGAPPVWAHATEVPACEVGSRVHPVDPELEPERVLLDLAWRLPPGYAPSDLVPVSEAGFEGTLRVRRVLIDDLRAMREAAEADGVRLAIQSAYRSESYQADVHARWVASLGAEAAARVSARPGHSEHQLGVAVDLRSERGPPAWELDDWSRTLEGAWVAAHAHRFGFVISYPRDAQTLSCYDFEPWHLRWVGQSRAAEAAASGLPYRAWLYLNDPPPPP